MNYEYLRICHPFEINHCLQSDHPSVSHISAEEYVMFMNNVSCFTSKSLNTVWDNQLPGAILGCFSTCHFTFVSFDCFWNVDIIDMTRCFPQKSICVKKFWCLTCQSSHFETVLVYSWILSTEIIKPSSLSSVPQFFCICENSC